MMRFSIASEKDAVDAVAAARERGTTLEILGRGTKRGFGRPIETDAILDVSPLTGIVSYEPDELVITAKAATPLAEIDAALAPRSQRLGLDPADWGPLFEAPAETATIGGVLSADACGSARISFGGARDHLLGYRAVNGFAQSYKAGGRVVKNVTGFDLPKLMCGAMGTLGVLTEVTLRLVPRAPLQQTLVAHDMAPEAGLTLLRLARNSAFGPTGLAYIPGNPASLFPGLKDIGAGAALVRVEGARAGLDEKIAGLRALAGRVSLSEIDGEELFGAIGDGRAFTGSNVDVWRVMLPPLAAALFATQVDARLWLADWAGGLIWIGMPPEDEPSAQKIRDAASAHGGHAILLRAGVAMRRRVGAFSPQPQALAGLTSSVKAAFDPLGIFNPGRMYEGV